MEYSPAKRRANKMNVNDILWGVLPFVVATIFIGGHIYRYQKDQFGWTTKSSEFLEKRRLRIGSLLLHWGILFVIGGHIMGLIIPIEFYNTLGISEGAYHQIAIVFGFPAGIMVFIGLVLLLSRRINVTRVK